MQVPADAAPGVTVVGDLGGEASLQAWFDARPVGRATFEITRATNSPGKSTG